MHWAKWVIATLTVLLSLWMGFDGLRALIVGDYVTPSSGAYAGQLGPWAQLLSQFGLEPRSTGVKIAFVIYALAGLAATVGFMLRLDWGFSAMAAVSIGTLWYLPFGTLLGLTRLALLFLFRNNL